MSVFCELGYEATSVANLGAAMNMKPPSLYNAFGDKESLFIEVLEHYHRPYRDNVQSLFEQTDSAKEAIRLLFLESKRLHGGANPIGCLVVNSTINVGSSASAIADKIKSLHDTTEKLVKRKLKEGQTRGEIEAGINVTKLARYVCGILLGAAAMARGQKSSVAVRDMLDQGYEGFLRLAER